MARETRTLTGRIVAITGGARGIGKATAAALTARGARVAIGDLDGALVERTAHGLGAGSIGLQLDVTDSASFGAFLDRVESQLGPLDVLINNAGIMPIGSFVEESDGTSAWLVGINLGGVILGSRLALKRFLPRGQGHLVNIASWAGKAGFPGGATYCATKHAVVGLSEALRLELRGTGVDVSVVMPIVVNTELGSGLASTKGFKPVKAADVADAIVGALQTRRYEIYVPQSMAVVARLSPLLPRRALDAVGRFVGTDQVLARPDRAARGEYEARIRETVDTPEGEAQREAA